jgi:hypothetical protein
VDINQQKEQFSSNFVRVQNLTTVTIELPRTNQFTVEALSTMIQRIGEGGFP